jgi:carboxypeptidase family protein
VSAALLLVAQLLAGAQPVDTPALVSGRVLDADTGRPVAGALVTPYGPAAAGTGAVVLTNAGGQFVIRGLHPGNLVLIARKGGYIDATQGQTRPGGFAAPLRVAAGSRYLDTDIRMWRHGVITGTVLDDAGDPVIGVRVRAFMVIRAGGRTGYTESGGATTDDRGIYRIAQLVPGTYVVAVVSKQTSIPTEVMDVFFGGGSTRAERDTLGREMKTIDAAVVPGGSSLATTVGAQTIPLEPGTATPTSQAAGLLVYPTTFYPSVRTPSQAAPVMVRSGLEHANADLLLHLERTSRVSGTLVSPGGLAAHVAVRLTVAGEDAGGPLDAAATITDASGAFTFAGVTAGQYVLSAVRLPRPPPDAPDDTRMTIQSGTAIVAPRTPSPQPLVAPPPVPADATLWARLPIAVGDQDVADLTVVLQEAPRMSGRLEFDGGADRPDPTLVSNLRIVLEPADGSPAAPGLESESGHPDEAGGFRTVGVPPGRYVVRVAGLPLPGWTFKGAEYEGRDLADTAVEMTKDVSGVVLSFTDRPSAIEGRVQRGMQPDAEAVVAAYPVDEAEWVDAGAAARRIKVAHATRDGSFTLANVPAGDYYVVAVKDDPASWQDPALLRALTPAARQIRVLEGERTAVTLRTVVVR